MIDSIPQTLKEEFIKTIAETCGKSDVELKKFSFSSGGCINRAGLLSTDEGDFFVKWNSKSRFEDMFRKEESGLDLLQNAKHDLKIPKTYKSGEAGEYVFLMMEYIDSGPRRSGFWRELGRGLAELHRNENTHFGLDYDNYIGSLEQKNDFRESWIDFFREERLGYTFELALSKGFFEKRDQKAMQNLFHDLESICPKNIPVSLIHGDLWSGNLITSAEGGPCIIDPAVYYGFREMEIAFTELFGGYNSEFYESYNEYWPLEPGYEERKDVWNLYPLLVHVNLFGASYVSSVNQVLKRYR